MAKADEAISTIDWIWLYDAYKQAVSCFGSDELAEKRLRAWLASGQLPWSCMSWAGPDANDIARLEREDRESIVLHILPSAAYHEGSPEFWGANPTIWWEKNGAREFSAFGARALGIKVSRAHLLAQLPEEAGTGVAKLGQTKPAERKLMEPKAWFSEIRKKHPRQQNERLGVYARRLHTLMQEADVTTVWPIETLRRRLYDK